MSSRLLFANLKRFSSWKESIALIYRTNPRAVNAFTGCVTFSIGDFLAQSVEAKKTGKQHTIDYVRSLQVGVLGVVMNGVFLHYWYSSLDRLIGSSMTSKIGVGVKVLADQLIYAPFAIITFFSFACVRTTADLNEAYSSFKAKMDAKFLTTFMADCALWPMSNFINFRFIPLVYRPTFTCAVQLVWQTYMSITSLPTQKVIFPTQDTNSGIIIVPDIGSNDPVKHGKL